MSSDITQRAVTIATSGTLSGAADLRAFRLVAVAMPSSWTAADLTFQVSIDGGSTYLELIGPAASAFQVSAAASQFIRLPKDAVVDGVDYMIVRSGILGTTVAQAAARTLTLLLQRT